MFGNGQAPVVFEGSARVSVGGVFAGECGGVQQKPDW